MKYRIRRDEEDINYIFIEDVVEADERLVEGYTVRYGVKLSVRIKKNAFFRYLRRSSGVIFDFFYQDGMYVIKSLNREDASFETDRIVLGGRLEDFSKLMDEFVSIFGKSADAHKRRVIKKKLDLASDSDLFKKCAELLKRYSQTSELEAIDRDTATEIYALLECYEEELSLCPMPASEGHKKALRKANSDFYNAVSKTIGLMFLCGLMQLYIFAFYVGLLDMKEILDLFSQRQNIVKSGSLGVFRNFTRAIENVADVEGYEMRRKSEERNWMPFIRLIEKRVEYIQRCGQYGEFVNRFNDLALEYSKDYCSFMDDETDEEFDDYKYIEKLLELEKAMYMQSAKCGLMVEKPSILIDDFYDVFSYLAWDKHEVLGDEFLRSVISSMKGIIEHAYEGCEYELTLMTQLAVEYAVKVNDGEEITEEVESAFRSRLDEIFEAGSAKVQEAYKAEKIVRAIQSAEEKRIENVRVDRPNKVMMMRQLR